MELQSLLAIIGRALGVPRVELGEAALVVFFGGASPCPVGCPGGCIMQLATIPYQLGGASLAPL